MKAIWCALLLFVIAGIPEAYGQGSKKSLVQLDTISVKAGHFVIIEKDAYYVPRDTSIIVPDTVDCYVKKHSTVGTSKFYNSLVEKLSNNRYSNLLYKLVFEKEEAKKAKEAVEEAERIQRSRRRYEQYEGRSIRNIKAQSLKVFGTDINDTTKLYKSFINNTVNSLHAHTRQGIIRQNLLIKPGNVIKPAELADNERILRQLDFIKDARIYVGEDSDKNQADLYVVTRDVFPLKFDYSSDEETNTSSIGISNINIFGTGQELENNIIINDPDKNNFGETGLGYDGYYRVQNVMGSFLASEINYVSSFANSGYAVKLFREFFTPDIEYAGGFEFSSKEKNEFRAFDNETDSIFVLSHKEDFQDFWFAKSFKVLHVPSFLKARERLRFIVSGRLIRRSFVDRPEVRTDFNEAFHDRTNVLVAVGLTSRGYFKDRLIRSFGRTEDIPVGTAIQLTGGRQLGEFFDRNYFGIEFSEADVLQKFGYLRGTLRLGGFYREGTLEQGVLNVGGEYFSRLYSFNLFKLRQFITLNYVQGIRRKSQDFIDINDADGIRGLYNFFLIGTEKIVLSLESVLFTPLYLGGFRTAFFGFVDLAEINTPRAGNFYYGAGLGIRLKNDDLALNTIQLRFGFYPSLPFTPAMNNLNFSTIGNLGIQDFDIASPEILEFK